MRCICILILLLASAFAATREVAVDGSQGATHWLAAPNASVAQEIAHAHRAEYVGPVDHLDGFFLVREHTASRFPDAHPVFTRLEPIERVTREMHVASGRDEPSNQLRGMNPWRNDQWNLDSIHADAAWTYTKGRGALIHIVDAGIHESHPELTQAIPSMAWDVHTHRVGAGADTGVTHGTSSASMAAGADNQVCGLGVAPLADLSITKLLGSYAMTDADEASALARLPNATVQSNSWGPYDDGRTLQMPGALAAAALQHQFDHGGIVVFAAGNGHEMRDNVCFDGYAGSPLTIAVGAVDSTDHPAYYSEEGSAVLISAPSSSHAHGVVAATGTDGCNDRFGGTSAAAPTVAGVIALLRSVRPELTFADVMDILARTARRPTDVEWIENGAGLHWNNRVGFGVVNAVEAVEMARGLGTHKHVRRFGANIQPRGSNVPSGVVNHVPSGTATTNDNAVLLSAVVHLGIEVGRCVLATVDEIVLESPAGTRIPLLGANRHMRHSADLQFTVRGVLGEHASGEWKVFVGHDCAGGLVLADNERSRIEFFAITV